VKASRECIPKPTQANPEEKGSPPPPPQSLELLNKDSPSSVAFSKELETY
jgi:hypothetical protein